MFALQAKPLLEAQFPGRNLSAFRSGDNLGRVIVCFDFDWEALKGNAWHQFTHGKKLGELVREECPDGKEPILYLTDIETKPRFFLTERLFIAIVPFRHYLESANPDPARSFFSYAANQPLAKLLDIAPEDIELDEVAEFVRGLWNKAEIRAKLLETVKKLYEVTNEQSADDGSELSPVDLELLVTLLTFVATSPSAQESLAKALESDSRLPGLESAVEAIGLMARRDVVSRFERYLNPQAGDPKLTEPQWEEFFRENPWLLGLNLRECVFLEEVQGQPDLAGKNLAGRGGQRGDSLMATDGGARFTVLVALKNPAAALVEDKSYRNKAHRPGSELSGGIVQVQAECFRWETSAGNYDKKKELSFKHRTHTVRPDGIVVVGDLRSIKDDEDKLASFACFRSSLHGVSIVTFDELLERAKALVA